MSTPTFQDVTNAIWTRLQTVQGFKTITKNWNDYTNAKNGRPALYFVYLRQERTNAPSGLPTIIKAYYQVVIHADKKAFPKSSGDEIILPLRQAVLNTIAPGPLDDGLQQLGLPANVAHCWFESDQAFYDLTQNDDLIEMTMDMAVLMQNVDYPI